MGGAVEDVAAASALRLGTLRTGDPLAHALWGNGSANSFSLHEIVENPCRIEARPCFAETGGDHPYICIARWANYKIIACSRKGKDRVPVLHADFHHAAVEAEAGDQPFGRTGEVFIRRDDDIAGNPAAVFLPDNVVELAVSDEVHAGISCRSGRGAPDEGNRAAPTIRVIGEIQLMRKHDWPVAPRSASVAAAGVSLRGACWRPTADIAIETGTEKIGSVARVPHEMVIGGDIARFSHC